MNTSFSKIYIIILSIASIAGLMLLYCLSTPYYVALRSASKYEWTVEKKRFFMTVDKKIYKKPECIYAVIFHPETDTTPEHIVCYNIVGKSLINADEIQSIGTKIETNAKKVELSSNPAINQSGYYRYNVEDKKFVDIDPKTKKAVPLSSFSLTLSATNDKGTKAAIVIAESGNIDKPSLVEGKLSPISLEVVTEAIEITEVE